MLVAMQNAAGHLNTVCTSPPPSPPTNEDAATRLIYTHQIYNEVIYDLLALAQAPAGITGAAAAAGRQQLKLKEVTGGHITVQGAAEVRLLRDRLARRAA